MDEQRFEQLAARYYLREAVEANELPEADSLEGLFILGYDPLGSVRISASNILYGENSGGGEITPDPDPDPILTMRDRYIAEHTPRIGLNYITDPNFRSIDWKMDSYARHRKEFGEFIMYAHYYHGDKNFYRTFTLVVGKQYKVSFDMYSQGFTVRSGFTGGVSVNLTNTNKTSTLLDADLTDKNYHKYSVLFTPTAPNVTLKVLTDNLMGIEGGLSILKFKNIQITDATTDTSVVNFKNLDDVIREAKFLYPLNSDYGLPDFVERSYTPSNAISLNGARDVIIEGKSFGHHLIGNIAITLWGCTNVTIRNCKFSNINNGPSIFAEGGSNILIERCEFDNIVRGVLISKMLIGNVIIRYNFFKNLFFDITPTLDRKRHAIQFTYCNAPGVLVYRNAVENIMGYNNAEDSMSFFNSYGTPDSPMCFAKNWIRGGGPLDPNNPVFSGCGMIMGDWGGGYLVADSNVLIDSSQTGVSIGGGNHIIIRNNIQYSPFRIYTRGTHILWNWTNSYEQTTDIRVTNNRYNWRSREQILTGIDAPASIRRNITNLTTDATIFDYTLDERILPPDMRIIMDVEDDSSTYVKPQFELPLPKDIVDTIEPYTFSIPRGTELKKIVLPTMTVTMKDGSVHQMSPMIGGDLSSYSPFPTYDPNVPGTYVGSVLVWLPIMGVNPDKVKGRLTIIVENN